MATYVIGDVQGCLEPLKQLLVKINYSPERDVLWFAGDLVNRGPQSVETLRFIKALPESTICVLGNHDLALLVVAAKGSPLREEDSFKEVLDAPDKQDLLEWLRHRPLLHHDSKLNYTLTHAGIYPSWDLKQAILLAQEIEHFLRGSSVQEFYDNIFGDHPTQWDNSLTAWARLRFITFAFTRMRFCHPNGTLDLTAKGTLADHPDLLPWFAVPDRPTQDNKLLFGHWASLNGITGCPNVYALDTGCVWGKCLTAFCLETESLTRINCHSAK